MAGSVLVTGASGFTGPYVVRELQARGYEVHGLVQGDSGSGDVIHQVDLRDQAGVARLVSDIQPRFVIHMAAVAFVGHQDFLDMYASNIVGTRNLLEALAGKGSPLERLILVSSANIYGNSDNEQLDENTPPSPQNDYAVSKYAMELMSRQFLDRLPIVTVRPFNYTGVGQSASFVIPKIVGHFARGESCIELGNLDVYRDFSDVRTVADAYARLLEQGLPGTVYNVCSGNGYSLRGILDQVTRLTGNEMEVRVNPRFVRANEVHKLYGSNARLSACIGELKSIPLDQTLAWMLEAAGGQ